MLGFKAAENVTMLLSTDLLCRMLSADTHSHPLELHSERLCKSEGALSQVQYNSKTIQVPS